MTQEDFNMSKLNNTGVYQLSNGNWGFRYAIVVDGKRIDRKRNAQGRKESNNSQDCNRGL